MKVIRVCLVVLASFCLSTFALPALSKEEPAQHYSKEVPTDLKKRGDVSYGTALGHNSKSNDYYNDMEKAYNKIFGKREVTNDWQEAYDSLFPSNEQRKRAPFTFGTALGHNRGSSDNSNYMNSLNAKFNELFGKRDDIDNAIPRWENEQ